ncbi:MAG TPA: hypothetical protein VF981_18290 [Gemmatimonadaceae bacterium]
MKPSRCRCFWGAGLALAAAAHAAAAQGTVGTEGGAFLLRPIGARAVGTGLAVVAGRDGPESLWWNPAAIAWVTQRELALHHSQDFFATGDAVTLIIPSNLLGVFGIAADLQNFGEQENTSDPSTPSTGTILTRSFVLSGSYATTVGDRTAAGVAFKVVQMRVDCTGPCDFPNEVAQTFAVDAGAQVELGRDRRFVLGASLRNLGLALQVEDSQQSDPLPSRIQLGVLYRYPLPDRYAADAALNLSADVVDGLRIGRPLPRLGVEFAWQERAFVRGGYVFESRIAEAGGPTLGLGFIRGGLVLDLARVFTGFSADAGQAPTYLSVRFGF